MQTLLCRRRARAMHSSCLSPTEKFSPFSMTGLSSCPASDFIFSFMLVRSTASQTASSEYFSKGSKLYLHNFKYFGLITTMFIAFYEMGDLMVPMKSTESWGIMDNFERRSSSPISRILIPSIFIVPEVSSASLNSATPKEDLPEPVRPTIPEIFNVKFKWSKGLNCWRNTNFFLWFNVKRNGF